MEGVECGLAKQLPFPIKLEHQQIKRILNYAWVLNHTSEAGYQP